MLRTITTGLVCLGLGSAAFTAGDEVPKSDSSPVVEAKTPVEVDSVNVSFTEAKPDVDVIEITQEEKPISEIRVQGYAGDEETRLEGSTGRTVIVDQKKPVITNAPAGKAINIVQVTPGRFAVLQDDQLAKRQAQIEKLKARLHEDAARLAKEGKGDEADELNRSIQLLTELLAVKPQVVEARVEGAVVARAIDPKERERLKVRIDELEAKLKANPGLPAEEVDRIRKELAELDAQRTRILYTTKTVKVPHVSLVTEGYSSNPNQESKMRWQLRAVRSDREVAVPLKAETQQLEQKVIALKRAAEALHAAGLADQSRELANQAQKIGAEIAAINERARAEHLENSARDRARELAAGSGSEHDQSDLNRSIIELREQVQLLRKEVAELREILSKPR